MDVMQEISAFIESNDAHYLDGIFLLEQVSKKTTLINFLRRKENTSNRNKLIYELNKVLQNGPEKSSSPVQRKYYLTKKQPKPALVQNLPPKPIEQKQIDVPADDPTLHKLSIEKGEVHLERAAMANRMKLCKTDAQRKEVYQNCIEIQGRYDVVAKQINHYMKTGEKLEEKDVPATSTFRISDNPMDWPRQLNNLRSNASKLRTKLSKVSEDAPKATVWRRKLNQIKTDIANVEKAIEAKR